MNSVGFRALPQVQRQIRWLLPIAMFGVVLPCLGFFWIQKKRETARQMEEQWHLRAMNSAQEAILSTDQLSMKQFERSTRPVSGRQEWTSEESSLLQHIHYEVDRSVRDGFGCLPIEIQGLRKRLDRLISQLDLAHETGQTGQPVEFSLEELRFTLNQIRLLHRNSFDDLNRFNEIQNRETFRFAFPFTMGFVLLASLLCIKILHSIRRSLKEEEEAKQTILQSEDRYRRLVENAPYLIQELDLQGRLLSINSAGLKLMDNPDKNGLIGQPFLETVSPEDRPRIAEILEKTQVGQRSDFVYKSSRNRNFVATLVSLPKSSLGTGRILAMSMDITDKLLTSEILKISEARFRAICENSPIGIFFTDENGLVVYRNQAQRRILGRNLDNNSTVNDPAIYHEDDRERVRTEWEEIKRRRQPFQSTRRYRRPDGTVVWVSVYIAPVSEIDTLRGYVGIVEDITERKKVERQILRTQRLEALGTLAGGISHDLNNALAPLLMSIEMLRQQNPQSTSLLDDLEANTNRAAGMVRQLLMFARGRESDRVPLRLEDLLDEISRIIAGTFPKNIQVRFMIEPRLPNVLGDATQIHQMLLNLSVNARDAMPTGGSLTFEASRAQISADEARRHRDGIAGNFVVVRVRDTGCGISPEIIDHIFEPFFTTKGIEKGTGLGLSTVHGIVRGHGGFTTVHSELGHGSTFSVYLPESGRKPVADVSVARPSGGQKEELTVLVVDDEPTVQRVMCLLLERHHFKTLPASDGAEALRVIQRYGSEIGLIVTDMHMPHMDGLELVKQLSLTPPMPPVVLVSGLLEEHVQEAMQAMGVHAHLDKPFNEASLLEAVRKALAKKPV